MKLFSCPHCGHRLYFENAPCLNCGNPVLYDPGEADFVLSAGDGRGSSAPMSIECDCNWRAPEGQRFLPGLRPQQDHPGPVDRRQSRALDAGRSSPRSGRSIRCWRLACRSRRSRTRPTRPGSPSTSSPIRPGIGPGGEHVLTGHDNGLITLNVAEADSAEREKMRVEMGEPYRTLLGHFRHELGHYYWDRLIRDDAPRLRAFPGDFRRRARRLRRGAAAATMREGAPPDWQAHHISAYAAIAPLGGLGRDLRPLSAHHRHAGDGACAEFPARRARDGAAQRTCRAATRRQAPCRPSPQATPSAEPFSTILERWLVLSEASNSINRCMGLPDLYPFVISAAWRASWNSCMS